MDLLSTRAIDLTKLAMDGLVTRQKAVSANIANVMTPGYERKEVSFEDQLKEIVQKDDLKTMLKERNSMTYNPTSLDLAMDRSQQQGLTPQQAAYVQSDVTQGYGPQITDDTYSGSDQTGNNVVLEKEVMDMATIGIKYQALSALEQKDFRNISSAIKGEMSS